MGVSPARKMAFEVLRLVEKRRGEPVALLHDSRYRGISAPDKDLATEFVLGVQK